MHTLDSVTQPETGTMALTNLTLTGDTLSWDHNGLPAAPSYGRKPADRKAKAMN